MDRGRLICASHNIRRGDRSERRQLKLRRVDLNQIMTVYDHVVDLPEDYSRDKLDYLLDSISREELEVLHVEVSGNDSRDERLRKIRESLASLPCDQCEHLKICHGTKKGRLNKLLREFTSPVHP